MISCQSPYDINYAATASTNLLVYGVTGFDQTNYKVNEFVLNLKSALYKIFLGNSLTRFNSFCPVMD
jgi:hypothetical protein